MTETAGGDAVQSGTLRVRGQVLGTTSHPENPSQLEQPLADDAGLDSTDLQFLAIAHRDEIAAAWQGTECDGRRKSAAWRSMRIASTRRASSSAIDSSSVVPAMKPVTLTSLFRHGRLLRRRYQVVASASRRVDRLEVMELPSG